MSLSIASRMHMIRPISDRHADAVHPTVEAWATRAESLTTFVNKTLSAETPPITAFVSSEILQRKQT